MSEEKQHRTPQEIQAEYYRVCAEIGDLQVKSIAGNTEIQSRLDRVRTLNVEMLESNAYFAKLQAELEAKKNEKPQG